MQAIHLSIDDVNTSLINLSKSKENLFDNKLFKWLKNLHERYNLKVSLYLQNWGDILSQIEDNAFCDFGENSDWLRLGIHTAADGTDFEFKTYIQGKNEWEKFVTEVIRIGGTEDNIDTFPRLHRFVGNIDCLMGMRDSAKCAAVGFLSADDNRKSYYLDKNSTLLYKYNIEYDETHKLFFKSTDFRLDWMKRGFKSQYQYSKPQKKDVYKELKTRYMKENDDIIVIFTHEWQVYSKRKLTRYKKWIIQICKFASAENCEFVFPMDNIKY